MNQRSTAGEKVATERPDADVRKQQFRGEAAVPADRVEDKKKEGRCAVCMLEEDNVDE